MTKRKKGRIPPWSPFQRAVRSDGAHVDSDGSLIFKNSRYTVNVKEITPEPNPHDAPRMIQLSIKRNDKRPIFDWRDFQRIKNELVGPECEGCMLFPAESRLVDSSNQFWTYVFADPAIRFPFGFQERHVSNGNVETPYGTSIQRPFEPGQRPTDCIGQEEAQRLIKEHFQKGET